MMTGHLTGTLFKPLIHSGLRLGLTLIITLMVISSPIIMLVNPVSAASSFSTDGSPSAPSTIGQDGSDFTTQAQLSSLTARPSNNIVNTNSFYDVVFLTASSGHIKTIEVTFPAGTTIPSGAFFNEAEGIGPGTASKSGQTITYIVTNAVNVPVGTKIRLEFANINNPLQVSENHRVTVTTKNAGGGIIDGPSLSTGYTMKQIGSNAIANNAITTPKIADGAITSTKPAESFMKKVIVLDDAAGHAVGWDPDEVKTNFLILDQAITSTNSVFITIEIKSEFNTNHFCDIVNHSTGFFTVECADPPLNLEQLHYVIEHLPAHIVS